jgi:hypothetical protein
LQQGLKDGWNGVRPSFQLDLQTAISQLDIYYRRCVSCQLLFTEAFDVWSEDDFTISNRVSGVTVRILQIREQRLTREFSKFEAEIQKSCLRGNAGFS